MRVLVLWPLNNDVYRSHLVPGPRRVTCGFRTSGIIARIVVALRSSTVRSTRPAVSPPPFRFPLHCHAMATAQHSHASVYQSTASPIVDVPMSVLNRPLPSELDSAKIDQMMRDIRRGDEMTPIEVMRVRLPDGRQYYLSFGGCHRCALAKDSLRHATPWPTFSTTQI